MFNVFVRSVFNPILTIVKWGTVLALSAVLLFAYVPVGYTGVMLERQLQALSDDRPYSASHQWVPLSQISIHMQQAVVTSEDQRFTQHHGFDVEAIKKAWRFNQTSKKKRVRGASTISQQTAKNVFLWTGRSWFRKGLESAFTLLIEGAWGKERILEVYLNSIEFGDGIFGVEAASQRFFGIPASKLNKQQAALLAAVLPNPHKMSAQHPSAYVKKRQQWILRHMSQLAPIDDQLDDLEDEEL